MKNNFIRLCIIIVFIIRSVGIAFAQDQHTPYSIIIERDGFASFNGKNYTTIRVYLNNNTNDTLYYQSTDSHGLFVDCHNLLFTLKKDLYFHLANGVGGGDLVKAVLPPHRSQQMQLLLTTDKVPDKDVVLYFKMNLYQWVDYKAKSAKRDLLAQFSDSTILHYNNHHQAYWPIDARDDLDKKREAILPNKDIYLLTDKDRTLYRLTAEINKIAKPRDTVLRNLKNRSLKKAKVVTVPVVVHNNSNDTLRFYSMTCSWDTFFGTDQNNIRLYGWGCDNNISDIIEVTPHGIYKRYLPIVYDTVMKKGDRYRVFMSLLKAPDIDKRNWDLQPEDYVRYNKIWSNEIIIE